MRLVALLVLVLLGCAHTPGPPPGPRPLRVGAPLGRGEARLTVALRYEPTGARSLVLLVDLAANDAASVGPVAIGVIPDGLEIDGPATWLGEVAAGAQKPLRFPMRLVADKVGRITLTYGVVSQEYIKLYEFRFLSEDAGLRACQSSEAACRQPGEPAPD